MSLYLRDPLISRLVRMIMKDGKKHAAMNIVDDCFAILRKEHGVGNPCGFAKAAIENAKPLVETRKYRASGRAIQVPSPCKPARQESLALRFLRDSFRERSERGSGLRLAKELVDLEQRTGRTYKKREELHKRAEMNRAFAHFLR